MPLIKTPKNSGKFLLTPGYEVYIAPNRSSTPIRIGFMKDGGLESDAKRNEEGFSSGILDRVSLSNKTKIKFSLAEQDPAALAVLFSGLVQREVIAGTALTGVSEVVNSGEWTNVAGAAGNVFKLKYKNASNAVIAITSITGSVTGVIPAAQYTVAVNTWGETTITFLSTITNINQNLTILYNVTPPAQDRIIYNKSCGVPTPFIMRIVRTITDCTTSISKDYFTDFENCTCSVTLPELKDVLATDTPLRPIEVMGYLISEVLQ